MLSKFVPRAKNAKNAFATSTTRRESKGEKNAVCYVQQCEETTEINSILPERDKQEVFLFWF